MTPGIWTSYFVEFPAEKAIELLAGKGWRHLELSDEHGAELLERGSPERVGADIRRFSEDRGVVFPQGHLKLSINIGTEDSDGVIDELRAWLDLFMALGVKAGVLHPGWREHAPEDEIMEARLHVLHALSRHLGDADFTICLENLQAHNAADLLDIIEKADCPHLGICLDTGHLNQRTPGQGQADFILAAGRRLKALHLAENDGTSDQHLAPFARGSVPWHEVTQALRKIGYTGLFNLEIGGERFAPLPVKKAKLEYFKTVMEVLLTGDSRRPAL